MVNLTNTQILDGVRTDFMADVAPINETSDSAYQISFQFVDSEPPDKIWDYSGYVAWTDAQKGYVRAALTYIETFLNVDFVELTGNPDPDITFGRVNLPTGVAGEAGPAIGFSGNTLTSYDASVVYDSAYDLSTMEGMETILHEIGHALGLKHTFESPVIPSPYENTKFSVMSYTTNPDSNLPTAAMMMFDIFALQSLWGAATYNGGDTSYTGPRMTTMSVATSTDTIWDTGGTDTLDASALSVAVSLNLNDGEYSNFGQSYENVSIGIGVEIENATGGSGNDTIVGNELANVIRPGGGADNITTGSGNDSIRGSSADLIGDTFEDFVTGDRIIFEGVQLADTMSTSSVSGGTSLQLGSTGSMTFANLASGGFLLTRDTSDTIVEFFGGLPSLSERSAVASSDVNGVESDTFLTGNNASTFFASLNSSAEAGFSNVLGAYEINASGEIVDVVILYDNAKTGSGVVTIDNIDAGNTLGFFLLQDAASQIASLSSSDTFSFIDGSGGTASLSDGSDLQFAVNGSALGVTAFHSNAASMNADGVNHVLSGVLDSGNGLVIGFEDMTGGGDMDYQDVLLNVTTESGLLV